MPQTPKGYKRPADVIGNAVHIMKVATGEIVEEQSILVDDSKNRAAVELGHHGGVARAKAIGGARRKEIARNAARTRWKQTRRPPRKA
jgi:hypothetical protein